MRVRPERIGVVEAVSLVQIFEDLFLQEAVPVQMWQGVRPRSSDGLAELGSPLPYLHRDWDTPQGSCLPLILLHPEVVGQRLRALLRMLLLFAHRLDERAQADFAFSVRCEAAVNT